MKEPASADWKIRPMQVSDLSDVERIEQASYDYPWTPAILADCLRSGYSSWVAESESGTLAAYAFLSTGAGEGHVLNLCVSTEQRGQGLGRKLLRHLKSVASSCGVQELFLEVRRGNRAATRLYRSEGFQAIGLRQGYYPGPQGREDATVYACPLVEP